MKKGKVFGKTQIALAIMVVALGTAIWLNMKYSTVSTSTNTSSKYLGQAEYVNAEVEQEEDIVNNYFEKLKKERKEARDESVGIIEEALANPNISADDREKLLLKSQNYAERTEKEAAIETILKAKGFNYTVAVIGDDDINVIILSGELKASETAQVRDAVMSQTDFAAGKIKIITMTKKQIMDILE